MGPFTTESHRDTQHALTAGLHDRRGGLGKDRGIGGPVTSASSYFMKSPPEQFGDDVCRDLVEKFIRGEVER